MALSAKWPGFCPACGVRYSAGTLIEQYDAGWGHATCPPKAANKAPTPPSNGRTPPTPPSDPTPPCASAATEWATFVPSAYQDALRLAFATGTTHLSVGALAGSGKTTSTRWLMSVCNIGRAIYLSFNSHIIASFRSRVPAGVEVRTLNAMGQSIVSAYLGRKLAPDSRYMSNLYRGRWEVDETDAGRRNRDLEGPVVELCALVRGSLVEPSVAACSLLAQRHAIEGFDADPGECAARVAAMLAEHVRRAKAGGDGAFDCDFDSQIWLPAALDIKPASTYDTVFIDEAQDLNAAQHDLVMRLAGKTGRVVAIGDKHQCVTADTEVSAFRDGDKVTLRADEVREGDLLVSGDGSGRAVPGRVLRVHKKPYKGKAVEVTTKGGRVLLTTAEHIYFADYNYSEMGDYTEKFFVYLMKKGENYRIGKTQCFRNDNNLLTLGFAGRGRQEGADAAWILMVCDNDSQARYWETVLSLRYQIPQTVFVESEGSNTPGYQKTIDAIFAQFDTEVSAGKLLAFLGMSELYPHWTPKCMTSSRRRNFNITMLGDPRGTKTAHRYSIAGSDPEDAKMLEAMGLNVRKSKGEGWRVESSHMDLAYVHSIREKVEAALQDINIIEKVKLSPGRALSFMPASHVREGMSVYVLEGDQVVYDQVVRVGFGDYTGEVCDFDIETTHNFCAGGIFTHNSIYSFRGAGIASMEDLTSLLGASTRGVTQMPLSICYRCPAKVIRLVRETGYCPDIEARPDAPEGEILVRDYSKLIETVMEGETGGKPDPCKVLILSSLNAPLVPALMSLIREGIPGSITGKDASKDIRKVMARVKRRCNTSDIGTFLARLNEARESAITRALQRNEAVETVSDVYDTIACLTEAPDCETIQALEGWIDRVFDPEAKGVALSTVHRAKGLEYPTVIILRPDAMPVPWARQEWEQRQARNLAYVAFTRAMERLVFLTTQKCPMHPEVAAALERVNGPASRPDPEPPTGGDGGGTQTASAKREQPQASPGINLHALPPIDALKGLEPLSPAERINSISPESPSDPEPVAPSEASYDAGAEDAPADTAKGLRTPLVEVPRPSVARATSVGVPLDRLPQHPTKGDGSYVPPTLEDWTALAAEYSAAGCQAELTRPTGWYQMALIVQKGPRMVRVSTTVDKGASEARNKGKNAIDICLVENVDGRPIGGMTKVLRRDGWRGRVCERINGLLTRGTVSV